MLWFPKYVRITINMKAKVDRVFVKSKQLPFFCTNSTATAGAHPKVYIAFNCDGIGSCYYCGTKYQLVDESK